MKDSEILGTGNSRYLKSAIGAAATWEEARAMLIAGTFPIDFNGINEAGFAQVGDALNKNNLLKDATAALLGGDSSMVPDEALVALKLLFDSANDNADKRATIEVSSYTGTGESGASNPTKINFSHKPKIFIIVGNNSSIAVATSENDHFEVSTMSGTTSQNAIVIASTLTWNDNQAQIYNAHSSYGAKYQCNVSNAVYDVVAFY